MEQACVKPPWPTCLAVRENLLPSGVPHIPVLVEDIPGFSSLSDYKENFVKSVQTIGEILPGEGRIVQLQSISSDREAKVTLSLERLPVNAVYFKDGKGRYVPIWEKCRVFKVFGTLEWREDKVVLMAHKLLRIQDIRGSLNTLSLLSAVVRPMYYQYKEFK
ncbi:uncharacterized protein LOC114935923 [Nylanderia fulva]|uniref:uncharacterized protein LOC114935923 n=1 Tax=Nylanderia fulva TaxID=613905 RepID=UPI0010FB647A|nr:uncharacterized protein LOC114935923 [Nylanderia fulva]